MTERRNPGAIRDAIVDTLRHRKADLSVAEIREAVAAALGEPVAASSVRSYLNINTPGRFTRTGRGRYKLSGRA